MEPLHLDRPTVIADRNTEIALLERQLSAALERARIAEEQLQRVHAAIAAAKSDMRQARDSRRRLLAEAQRQAEQMMHDARRQVDEVVSEGDSGRSGFFSSWASIDPELDERFDSYLENDFEPDQSRKWILRDGSG